MQLSLLLHVWKVNNKYNTLSPPYEYIPLYQMTPLTTTRARSLCACIYATVGENYVCQFATLPFAHLTSVFLLHLSILPADLYSSELCCGMCGST